MERTWCGFGFGFGFGLGLGLGFGLGFGFGFGLGLGLGCGCSMATFLWWKMLAARAASTPVRSKTWLKCSGAPAPLLAMTGTETAALIESSSGRS